LKRPSAGEVRLKERKLLKPADAIAIAGIFISKSVESLLSKASGNKNERREAPALFYLKPPPMGWPKDNPLHGIQFARQA
jgi:hypothetical protein